MDSLTRDKISHFRGKPRPGRTVAVTYRAAATTDDEGVPRVEAVTRNLGAGGAFVLCDDPLPIGARVELILHLPRPARDIDVAAEVRWRVTASDGTHDAGMGLQFVDIAVDDLLALKEYFASLTGTDAPA
jgi:uncharacterized protein (TIGR02266 family)